MTSRNIAGQFCGQTQPHDAHSWQTPGDYGTTTFVAWYQCAGLTVAAEPPPERPDPLPDPVVPSS